MILLNLIKIKKNWKVSDGSSKGTGLSGQINETVCYNRGYKKNFIAMSKLVSIIKILDFFHLGKYM